jgi:hypothetical protein
MGDGKRAAAAIHAYLTGTRVKAAAS